jgi:NAD(P)-dependent dehydrogenase (short-subunit alcohol dehydrogenase family)
LELAGARVLITGASRGIGAALAEALRSEGCELILVARTAVGEVQTCDVSDPDQVEALFRRTGAVDVLVNNAAVIHEPAPLVDLALEEWERLFRINVFGMVAMLRRYVPPMNERGRGFVLNVSSTWGRVAARQQSPYCATKFAVEGLSASLAREVRPGVAVVAVNPGVVATEMLATCFRGDVAGATPPGRCAASFVRLLRKMDESWNGRSVDVDSY